MESVDNRLQKEGHTSNNIVYSKFRLSKERSAWTAKKKLNLLLPI